MENYQYEATALISRTSFNTGEENLKNIDWFFRQPAEGWNQGRVHGHNGVDISNVCGTEIKAAAAGIISEEESDGWNGGYGGYVVIEHLNGADTLYAHTEKNLVRVGDIVYQGQEIALMGKTGEATGCHLHFETHGAHNFLER